MTHEEMNELYELYVLGALEPAETAAINEHVSEQCAYCLQHIGDASFVTAAMSGLAEALEPPARLRKRVLASVTPEVAPKRNWLWAVAGLSAACAALLIFALWTTNSLRSYQARDAALESQQTQLRAYQAQIAALEAEQGRLRAYRAQIADLQAERNQLREAVEILSRSETRTVLFGSADRPQGRVFVNRNRGVVFVGSRLPALPQGRTFQLWLIPTAKGAAPQSAGLFRPNAAGDFVQVRREPVDTTRIQAVAVSVEPAGGSPAPTTTPVLIVPLG